MKFTVGSVRVSANLQTSDPAIFAGGDIARWDDGSEKGVRIEHWRVAEQHGLVVIFHCGLGEAASPDRVARVARDFPRVSVIAGHSGLIEGLRRVVEHARELPNLHMDSSGVGWIPYFCESVSWAGPDRVLYGSDTPFNHMKMELDKILIYANAHLQLSVEDLRLVMGGNLKRLLGMA